MAIGHYELQIFTSLVVILGAAFVALICDFLKGNNEQLRELAIELKVRRDEERRLLAMLRAYSRGLIAPPQTVAVPEAPEQPQAQPAAPPPVALSTPANPVPVASQPVVAKNWSVVLARGAETAGVPKSTGAAPVAAVDQPAGFPVGFHEGGAIQHLAERGERVNGLVVSIGLNMSRAAGGPFSGTIRSLIQSLIGPQDFACQSGEDEFLLICPQDHGAAAQRRLSGIAEQLWSFQLASMATSSVVFSWGGVEVHNEPIEEAMASASERMQETRRGRKLLLMKPAGSNLRRAV